jgi:hypothetical protein
MTRTYKYKSTHFSFDYEESRQIHSLSLLQDANKRTVMTIFVALRHPYIFLLLIICIWEEYVIHQMTPERQICPDVAFKRILETHFKVWVIFIVEYPSVTVKYRITIQATFLYFNLHLSVMIFHPHLHPFF